MTRTLSWLLLAVTAIGVVATPGLAGLALLIVPLAFLAVVWWIALGVATPGRRAEAVARVRHREFLGPGGPDDPFRAERSDPASAADGRVRDRRELEDQRSRQEDEAERDLVEVPEFPAARREHEHHERREHRDECEHVHARQPQRSGR
jgi:hypothetical protein